MWERELNSLAGARVHTKQNLPLPFQYKNLPTLDDQFISSPSWLPSPRFELRTLADYRRPVRKADNLPPSCAVVMKSGNLNFLEPSGLLQACNETANFLI